MKLAGSGLEPNFLRRNVCADRMSTFEAIAQALATDLMEDRIAVAALHPGWARTDMGGPGADIAPRVGAVGVKSVLDGLTLEATDQFWNYDGSMLEW